MLIGMHNSQSPTLGLVLTGGGARAAYQAGVVKALAEIAHKNNIDNPFQVYTGASAGAVNASYLASRADEFYDASIAMADMWAQLTPDRIFRTDFPSFLDIMFRWFKTLFLGSITGKHRSRSLLNNSPLGVLLDQNVDFPRISTMIDKGFLKGVAITCTDFENSHNVSFIQCKNEIQNWARARRRSLHYKLNRSIIMGSSAIPIVFPPEKIGERFYGDGCVRNNFPLSPAIHLGANKLVIIGVNKIKLATDPVPEFAIEPSVAQVFSIVLNALLLDSVETDIERLNRINETLKRVATEPDEKKRVQMKKVEYLMIKPSIDIGHLASGEVKNLPRTIRYLISSLGTNQQGGDLISYLAFTPSFCGKLIKVGYMDGMAREKEFLEFLYKLDTK